MREPFLYVGIDPGVSGALACYCPSGEVPPKVWNIPTLTVCRGGKTRAGNPKRKRIYDETAAISLLCEVGEIAETHHLQLRVALEDVQAMPRDSKPGCFTFGESKGFWRGALSALRMSYVLIRPNEWRPAMLGRGANKAEAIAMAKRLCPTVDLSGTSGHNRAEALLLAVYLSERGVARPSTKRSSASRTSSPKGRI